MNSKITSLTLILISILALTISIVSLQKVNKNQQKLDNIEISKMKKEASLSDLKAERVDEFPNTDKDFNAFKSFIQQVEKSLNSKDDTKDTTYLQYGNESSYQALKGVLDSEGKFDAAISLKNIIMMPDDSEAQSSAWGDFVVDQQGSTITYKINAQISNGKVSQLQLMTNQVSDNE